MLRTSVLVAGVMGAMAASTSAGVVTYGARVFTTGPQPTDDRSASVEGTGPSTTPYVASLPSFALSSLTWGESSWTFAGSATGGPAASDVVASATASATFSFTTDMYVSGSWDFLDIHGAETNVGWAIVDALGVEVFAIQYFGTASPNTAGGVTAALAGTFSGVLPAGNYTVSTFADNGDGGGAFESAMSFTAVPAPSPVPLVAVATLLARRGRGR